MRLIITLLLLFSFAAEASGASAGVTRFDRLSLEQGLSQASVNSIVQDRKGFLWFATYDGLNRYDGYSFKVFRHNPDDPNSISNNTINKLYIDSKGILWIGTDGGLNRYDANTGQFFHFNHHSEQTNSLSDNIVWAIIEQTADEYWIGTSDGLNRFNASTGQFKHYRHKANVPDSLSNNRIRSLYKDAKGILWIGTDGGLNRFNPQQQTFSQFVHQPSNPTSLSHNRVNAIIADNQGLLWLGTADGLNRFDPNSTHFTRFEHQSPTSNLTFNSALKSLSSSDIKSLFKDNKGTLWIGSFDGLNRYNADTGGFDYYKNEPQNVNSLSDNSILSIHQDNQGGLWLGTLDGGISKIIGQRAHFGHFKHQPSNPNSLSHNGIRAIHKDRQGVLWVGTGDGLNKNQQHPDKNDFIHFKQQPLNPNSISHNRVIAIHSDSNNILWVGTWGGGLNRYDNDAKFGGQFSHFKHQPANASSLSDNRVITLFEDSRQTLWAGTWGGGLNRYNSSSQNFDRFSFDATLSNSLSNNIITSIIEDNRAILWIGTYGGGLNRFVSDSQSFVSYQHQPSNPNSLSHDTVFSILQDTHGTLWIGTAGGLNKFDIQSNQFSHYREKHGLANDTVYGVVEDNQRLLWLSTNKGLSRFNPRTETFKNYDVNDGLQSNEFNSGTYFKSTEGELFFGGINGFNRFFPDNIKDDTQGPTVVLTDFLLANQSVAVQTSNRQNSVDQRQFTLAKTIDNLDHLTLTHQQNLISFEFAALHFTNPMKNQYAYKLEGQDKNWIVTDAKKRWATYTNLPAGDYTLRIKASNKDGYWNEQGKSLNITVLPPPWKTWWAYTIYVMLLSSPIFAIVFAQRRRIRYEHALNLELEQKDSERTAQLVQKNIDIIDTQQQLIQAEKMASLGTLTAGIAHEINNPTNFVYASSQNLEVDLGYFQQFLFDLAGEDASQAILDSFIERFKPLYQHLTTIKNGTKRIKIIVDDLKTFTQLDCAEQTTVMVSELLQSTINLVQPQFVDVVEFITEFEVMPPLHCFPAQLNQVFINLMVNACEAIDKGQVIIGCRVCHQGEHGEIEAIEISIKDNGCGMSEEGKTKLFEPFYTTKEVGQGTGLGLSIAFGIVQKHGGELSVESQLGQGSTFLLRLPLTPG